MPIKIFSAPHCPHSNTAKRFFEMNRVAFTDLNVLENESAYEEMLVKSHQSSVPVIEIGGDIYVGFNQRKMKEALGLNQGILDKVRTKVFRRKIHNA